MKKWLLYIPFVTFLIGVAGWAYQHDMSLARASDVLKVREEIRLMNQRYMDDSKKSKALYLDKRIWTIKQRYQYIPMDQTTKEMVRDLELELEQLRREGY